VERIKQMAAAKKAHEAQLTGQDVERVIAEMQPQALMAPAPKPKPVPKPTTAAAAPPVEEYTGPVGPGYPTAEQRKIIRELRISSALNAVICYIKLVDSDPQMRIGKEKEAEMKQLMGRAMDFVEKVSTIVLSLVQSRAVRH
jgi:hypothetical protein